MSSQAEVTQEVRFAIVIYGGTSLAIYLHGVVHELLRLVRSTAFDKNGQLLAPVESETVYRELGRMLGRPDFDPSRPLDRQGPCEPVRTRFVIDLISGTSAGGINGVFLAKALANGQSLDTLKDLWYEEGDISLLLNDSGSRDARVKPQPRPGSLLNSARMYDRLFAALRGMERSGSGQPLVDELDLFVTATDIDGLTLPIALFDGVVLEKRHKAVFPFRFGGVSGRNDFTANDDATLAFAARCTSSFPLAFEPMQLTDIDDILRAQGVSNADMFSYSPRYRRIFNDYLDQGSVQTPYERRAFGDGGYLDNKPFSHAIDHLRYRRAYLPVDRKLFYLEPNPSLDGYSMRDTRPDAIDNAFAALIDLPRYETIREDLQKIRRRNAEIARRREVVKEIEGLEFHRIDPTVGAPAPALAPKNRFIQAEGTDWARQSVKDIGEQLGSSYLAYQRLKVQSVLAELVEQVRTAWGIEEYSALHRASRVLFGVWQKREFGEVDQGDRTDASFLLDFDMPYRLRRLEFVMSRADQLMRLRRDEIADPSKLQPKGPWLVAAAGEIKELGRYHQAMRELRASIVERHRELLEVQARAIEHISKLPAVEVLWRILGVEEDALRREGAVLAESEISEDRMRTRAMEVYGQQPVNATVGSAASNVARLYREVFMRVSGELKALFAERLANPDPPELATARRHLAREYSQFEAYDSVLFPITYNTDVGEGDEVDIIRVSPADATARKKRGEKLRGTALWNFGAFLDRRFRENDLLWGRIDGAERLITALLPGKVNEVHRKKLIDEAHEAILSAELPKLLDPSVGHGRNALDRHEDFLETVPGKVPAEMAVRTAGRSARIVGTLLDSIADRRNVLKKESAYLLRLTRLAWVFAEVVIPKSIGEIVFRYVLALAFVVQVLMLLVALIFPGQQILLPGLARSLSLTIAIALCWWGVREYIVGHRKAVYALASIVVAGILALAIVGLGQALNDFEGGPTLFRKGLETLTGTRPAPLERTSLAVALALAVLSSLRMEKRGALLKRFNRPYDPFQSEDLAFVKTGEDLRTFVGHEEHHNRWLLRSIVEADFVFLLANGFVLVWLAINVLEDPARTALLVVTVAQVLSDVTENVGFFLRIRSKASAQLRFGGWLQLVCGLKFLLTGVAAIVLGAGVLARAAVPAPWLVLAGSAALFVAGFAFLVDAFGVWLNRKWRVTAFKVGAVAYGIGILTIAVLAILEWL